MKAFKISVGLLLILFVLSFAGKSFAQYDTIAIAILDSMSYKIGELESCSFKFVTENDIPNDEFGLITHGEFGKVTLKAPNRMHVDKKGDKGHKEFFSNGKSFSLYSHDKNQYATAPATMSLIEFIDSLSGYYGIEFPGTDVFYPDFVDNILATSNNLIFLGLAMIGENECYHVAGARDDMTFQIWISSDGRYLPERLTLVYILKPGNPRYSIAYSDWKLNESIDDSKFSFKIPEGAKQIKLIQSGN
jgi:hypothetical protein